MGSPQDRESHPLLGGGYDDEVGAERPGVVFDDQPIQERWEEEHEREKAAFDGDVESQDPRRSAPGVVRVRTAHSHHAPAVRARYAAEGRAVASSEQSHAVPAFPRCWICRPVPTLDRLLSYPCRFASRARCRAGPGG